jgi:hypothetical protein
MSIPVNYNISPREKQLFRQCLFGRTHKIKERILKAFDFGFIENNQDDPHKFFRKEGIEKGSSRFHRSQTPNGFLSSEGFSNHHFQSFHPQISLGVISST